MPHVAARLVIATGAAIVLAEVVLLPAPGTRPGPTALTRPAATRASAPVVPTPPAPAREDAPPAAPPAAGPARAPPGAPGPAPPPAAAPRPPPPAAPGARGRAPGRPSSPRRTRAEGPCIARRARPDRAGPDLRDGGWGKRERLVRLV